MQSPLSPELLKEWKAHIKKIYGYGLVEWEADNILALIQALESAIADLKTLDNFIGTDIREMDSEDFEVMNKIRAKYE